MTLVQIHIGFILFTENFRQKKAVWVTITFCQLPKQTPVETKNQFTTSIKETQFTE